MKISVVLGLVVATTAITLHGRETLRVKVSPAYAFAPANLQVRVMLEPSADNRALEIAADGESFYRSSEIDLEGERAPRSMEFNFRNLPGGAYRVTAVVKGADGHRRAMANQNVTIMSAGDPDRNRD